MPTSGDKWPEGYKGLVSAVRPYASVLSLLSLINTTATLNWSVVNNDCIPISSYNIYENGQLIANVPFPTNTFTYTNCDTNTYYITSISGTTESEPSNTVTITSPPQQLEAPVLSLDSYINNIATLSWTFVNNDCIPISSFNIYDENGQIIATVPYPTNSATFTVCGGNSFSVTSVSGGIESQPSNPPVVIEFPFTTTGGPASYTVGTNCNYIVTFTGSGSILFNRNVGTVSCIVVGGGGGADYGQQGVNIDGGRGGNGGGGGQVIQTNLTYSINTSYNIVIGAGGTGGYWVTTTGPTVPSTDGSHSSLDSIIASGGLRNSGGNGGAITAGNIGFPGSPGSIVTSGYGGSGGGGGAGAGINYDQQAGNINGGGGGGGSSVGGGGGQGGKNGTLAGGGGGNGILNTGGGGGGGGGGGSVANPWPGGVITNNIGGSGGAGGSGIIILSFTG
jgi:hypothetical protein